MSSPSCFPFCHFCGAWSRKENGAHNRFITNHNRYLLKSQLYIFHVPKLMGDSFLFFKLNWLLYLPVYLCVYTCRCTRKHTRLSIHEKARGTPIRSQVSPSSKWVLGIELKPAKVAASTFTHWVVWLAPPPPQISLLPAPLPVCLSAECSGSVASVNSFLYCPRCHTFT